MLGILIFILSAGAAAFLIFLSKKCTLRRANYINGMEEFMAKCRPYEASVLDVADVPVDNGKSVIPSVILSFRDEENRKTIVHRYTGSGRRKYKRGDAVTLYYCEETDSACIKNDNPFKRKADLCFFLEILCCTMAGLLLVGGVTIMVIMLIN